MFLALWTDGLILSHLPNGPTAHFKMSSVRLRKEIKVSFRRSSIGIGPLLVFAFKHTNLNSCLILMIAFALLIQAIVLSPGRFLVRLSQLSYGKQAIAFITVKC